MKNLFRGTFKPRPANWAKYKQPFILKYPRGYGVISFLLSSLVLYQTKVIKRLYFFVAIPVFTTVYNVEFFVIGFLILSQIIKQKSVDNRKIICYNNGTVNERNTGLPVVGGQNVRIKKSDFPVQKQRSEGSAKPRFSADRTAPQS